MAEGAWRIELFGGLEARCGERVLTHFETRKIAALLACPCRRLRRSRPREALAEQLWPDEGWDATRNRLRQALSALRHDLEPTAHAGGITASVLQTDRAEARLDPQQVTTDVLEFDAAIAAARAAAAPERVQHL